MAQGLSGRAGGPSKPAELVLPDLARRRPDRVVDALLGAGLYGLASAEVRVKERHLVVIWVTLEPWAPMSAEGYPTETASLCIWDDDSVLTIPHNASHRAWAHRNPDTLRTGLQAIRGQWGALCLWFPDDPRGLRWDWPDGLDQYVTIVHRHLQAEEYARRHGTWPAEDAPHGDGPHPIRTASMRTAADRWRPAC